MITNKKNVPQKKTRLKPGTGGKGKFYRIEVRPKSDFKTFRTQDVGEKGGLERIAGKRATGSWATATWLISKDKATVKGGKLLITDTKDKTLLKSLRGPILHVKGDIFKSHPRKNIAEKDKPTPAMKKAQMANIKKAQAGKRKIK